MAQLARIETLVGMPLAGVDEVALRRFVDGRVREDQDLDFKRQLYGTNDSAKRDLAGDVAALANTVGGLLARDPGYVLCLRSCTTALSSGLEWPSRLSRRS